MGRAGLSASAELLVLVTVAGAELTKGQVITFLDAHCECTEGWLEPLLHEIYEDKCVTEYNLFRYVNPLMHDFYFQGESWIVLLLRTSGD